LAQKETPRKPLWEEKEESKKSGRDERNVLGKGRKRGGILLAETITSAILRIEIGVTDKR